MSNIFFSPANFSQPKDSPFLYWHKGILLHANVAHLQQVVLQNWTASCKSMKV